MRFRSFLLIVLFTISTTVFAQEPITSDNADWAIINSDLSDDDRDFQEGALSPDGSLIAVHDIRNDTVLVFDSVSGDIVLEIPYPDDLYTDSLTFNGDGTQIIVLWTGGLANYYDIESGESMDETMFDFPVDHAGERTLSLRLDTETSTLFVYVTEDDEVIFESELPGFFSAFPTFSADGSTFAFVIAGDVYVVDVESGELGDPLFTFEFEYNDIESLALNSDGSVIAISLPEEYVAMVYDVARDKELFEIDATEDYTAIDNLRFSPDGSVLYASIYNEIMMYNARSGDELIAVEFPVQGRIAAFDVSADGGTVFAASYQGLIGIGIKE